MTKKKKTIIIVSSVVVVLLIIIGALAGGKKQPEYTTQVALQGDLLQTVDATGQIESVEHLDLSFKINGRISSLNTKIGDEVKAGDVLARLDGASLSTQVQNASASLKQAEANLEKILSGASTESIQVAQKTVDQREQDVLTAKNNLENLKNKQTIELSNLRDSLITSLNNQILIAKTALQEIKETLNEPDAQPTLSIKNSELIYVVDASQSIAQTSINIAYTNIVSIDSSTSDNDILAIANQTLDALNKVSIALSDTLSVLSATTISSDLTQTELDTLKSSIQSQQSIINTAKSTLQTSKSSWTNAIVSYEDQITSAENAISQAEKALATAGAELIRQKTPAEDYEIKSAQAQVEQARANLNLAYSNLSDTTLVAPLDGTITKQNYQVGEQVSALSPVFEIIGKSNLQIEIDIPESDIPEIKVGQTAEITLDAFGEDHLFAGSVAFVDPAETIIQDVVYYKVKIQLAEQYPEIKHGMTANVVIQTDMRENVIYVPFRAVKSTNGDKYVEVLVNQKEVVKKPITTGMRGDDGIEVISGISAGEEIITFTKE